jgi:taurine dioxygenase
MSTINVVPSSAPLGAEIQGVDLGANPGPASIQTIKDALHKYKVVVLRKQAITPDQQIAFSANFGTLEPHVLPQYLVPGYKDLVRVSNVLDDVGQPIGMIDAGRVWHSDGHFLAKPNMYSMLRALEVPHDDAGNPLGATQFANSANAYQRLGHAMRERLGKLRSINSLSGVYASLHRAGAAKQRAPLTEAQMREVEHPVIRTHPVTGEKCVYVSKAATLRILGLSEEESGALIDELSELIVRDDNVYTHRWAVGDVLIWDNCTTQHLAIGDYALPQRRLMHRTTVGGSSTF